MRRFVIKKLSILANYEVVERNVGVGRKPEIAYEQSDRPGVVPFFFDFEDHLIVDVEGEGIPYELAPNVIGFWGFTESFRIVS